MTLLVVNDSSVLHVLWYKFTCVGDNDDYRLDNVQTAAIRSQFQVRQRTDSRG